MIELQLGRIDYCDEQSDNYDEMDCETQIMEEDDRKQKRKNTWNIILKTGLAILTGGNPSTAQTNTSNTPNKTEITKNEKTALTYDVEKAMFNRLTPQEKRAYAKENPNSQVVKEWLTMRMWRNIGIGVGGVAVAGLIVYTIYKVSSNSNSTQNEKNTKDK